MSNRREFILSSPPATMMSMRQEFMISCPEKHGPDFFDDFGRRANFIFRDHYPKPSPSPSDSEKSFDSVSASLSSHELFFLGHDNLWYGTSQRLTPGVDLKVIAPYLKFIPFFHSREAWYLGPESESEPIFFSGPEYEPEPCDGNPIHTRIILTLNPWSPFPFVPYIFPVLTYQRFDPYASLAINLDLKHPFHPYVVKMSGSLGTEKFAIGTMAHYTEGSTHFDDVSAGMRFCHSNFENTVVWSENGRKLKASCVHYFEFMKRKVLGAIEIDHIFSTKQTTFTVGGAIEVFPTTLLKAQVNHRGKLGMLVKYDLGYTTQSYATLTAQMDLKTWDTPRFGLGIYV